MPVISVQAGRVTVDLLATGPQAQLSTAAFVTVAGADIDARPWATVAYTIVVAGQAVTWQVLAANAADYSDAVVVQVGASVVAGASSSYSVTVAEFAFYRVQIMDTVGGTHGTATVNGVAKSS